MIAFDISANAKKLCVAGVDEFGDLCAHLDSRQGPHVPSVTGFQHKLKVMELQVAGVHVRYKSKLAPRLKRGFAYSEIVEWAKRRIRVGDEVKIRVVEVSSCDEPRKRQPALAPTDETLRAHKRYIRAQAKALGWKIQTTR